MVSWATACPLLFDLCAKQIPMRTILIIFIMVVISFSCFAQKVDNLPSLKQKQPYDNTITETMNSDSNVTSIVIWIKKEIKPHYHANHSEHVMILEGEGQMLVDKQSYFVKPGDLIYIPTGTVHALRVTSKLPMKVLSIQTPQFDENDRVMVMPAGW
jgi:mannose-6-phosphate isomerase-like protein (cupin superfamily)